jgi:hypothetical protein
VDVGGVRMLRHPFDERSDRDERVPDADAQRVEDAIGPPGANGWLHGRAGGLDLGAVDARPQIDESGGHQCVMDRLVAVPDRRARRRFVPVQHLILPPSCSTFI